MDKGLATSQDKSFSAKKHGMLGIIIVVLLAIIEICFVGILIWTNLVPSIYLMIIGTLFAVLLLISAFLVNDFRRKGRFIIGLIISLIIMVILIVISMFIVRTKRAINSITSDVKTQYSDIGIWVCDDNLATNLAEANGYQFAALADLDRANTDLAISAIEADFGTEISVTNVDGLPELLAMLLDKEVDAIILNSAYLDVLEEMEGYQNIESQIRKLDTKTVETKSESTEVVLMDDLKEQKGKGVYCIYVGGSDSRGSIDSTSRNDVNLIITANMDTREILLLSTPRDYFVPLSISGGKPDKLTHAGIYGFDVSRNTLEMLYDIEIDYTFRINFAGFEKVVDALGGIDVYSDCAFSSGDCTFVVGENHLNGKQALVFCRERYAFASGDRQRGRNQMAALKAIISKATSPALLTGFTNILSSVADCIQTDIPYVMMTDVVKSMLDEPRAWTIDSFSVDGTGDTQVPYSMSVPAYVMWPDETTVEEAKTKMAQVRGE